MRTATVEIGEQQYDVVVKNVSFGGVRLVSDLRPEVGDELLLLDDKLGAIEGKVIRQTDDGFAIFLGQSNKAASYALRNVAAEMLDAV